MPRHKVTEQLSAQEPLASDQQRQREYPPTPGPPPAPRRRQAPKQTQTLECWLALRRQASRLRLAPARTLECWLALVRPQASGLRLARPA